MSSTGQSSVWSRTRTGASVRVRLTPKSSRDAVDGLADTAEGRALKARVRAVPEDGAANAAVVQLVATWIGVPKSSVGVTAGHKSRVKTLGIAGDPGELADLIARRLAHLEASSDTDRS